jgi:hypothetical protein
LYLVLTTASTAWERPQRATKSFHALSRGAGYGITNASPAG